LGTPREQREVAAKARPEPRRRGSAARAKARVPASAQTNGALLELEGVDVFYDRVQVLYEVDLEVRPGERIALLGTNGAGKSTILKAASGLLQPAAGAIRWKGDDTMGIAAERLVRMGLGHVPGGRGLFPTLTVEENLRLGGYIYDDAARVN